MSTLVVDPTNGFMFLSNCYLLSYAIFNDDWHYTSSMTWLRMRPSQTCKQCLTVGNLAILPFLSIVLSAISNISKHNLQSYMDHPHHYEYWIKVDIHLCMAICNLQTVLLLPPGVCTCVMVRSVGSSKYRWQNIIIITVPPSSHGARGGMTLQLLSRTVSVFWMFCDHSLSISM